MTTLILDENAGLWSIPAAGSSTTVFGTAAAETITVDSGATVSFLGFGPGDTLVIEGVSTDYQVHSAGSTVFLTHSSGAVISLPASPTATSLQFSDGNTTLAITSGAIQLGNQTITTSSAVVDLSASTGSAQQSTPATTGTGATIASEALANAFDSGYDSTYSYASDTNINSLLGGSMWGLGPGQGVALTYSFPTAGAHWESNYGSGEPLKNFQPLTASQQQSASAALALWADVANIEFTQITESGSTVADIRFGFSNDVSGGTAAWAYIPGHATTSYSGSHLNSYTVAAESGDVWINPAMYNDADWDPGSDNFHTLVHEIGHGLGLKHPFDTDGNGTVLVDDFDSYKYSVMSYTEHQEMGNLYTATGGGSYSFIPLPPATPLLYDVQAIQYMYGANYDTRTGDDTYSFSTTEAFIQAIWDGAGEDTIDASSQTVGVTINLAEGALSSVGVRYLSPDSPVAAVENLAIVPGAVIENAVGSAFADTLIGNAVNNVLTGGAGDDSLTGGDGIDTAIFSGNFADYQVIADTGSGTQVIGMDGTDLLIGIEQMQFADQLLLLG